jgi:hypothetical protein
VRWAARLADASDASTALIPYPMLATAGQDDSGHYWLLDLEHLGAVTVTGSADEVAAFGRYLVAELALDPWTVNLTTHAFGAVTGGASLSRYRVVDHDDGTILEALADDVRASTGGDSEDLEWFHVVIGDDLPAGEIDGLAEAIRGCPGRAGVAAVMLGGVPEAGNSVIELADGRIRVPAHGIDLTAVGLSADELAMSARIAGVTRDASDVPVPIDDPENDDGWRSWTDAAGAPRAAHAHPRPDDPDRPAGPGSLLPGCDADYVGRTANTRDDLARIAPVVSAAPADADV